MANPMRTASKSTGRMQPQQQVNEQQSLMKAPQRSFLNVSCEFCPQNPAAPTETDLSYWYTQIIPKGCITVFKV
jgi:hypothetical protein